MLGCVAAVIETESPSQPSPAVIQTMCTSATAGVLLGCSAVWNRLRCHRRILLSTSLPRVLDHGSGNL